MLIFLIKTTTFQENETLFVNFLSKHILIFIVSNIFRHITFYKLILMLLSIVYKYSSFKSNYFFNMLITESKVLY